jgi:hypothetical protein
VPGACRGPASLARGPGDHRNICSTDISARKPMPKAPGNRSGWRWSDGYGSPPSERAYGRRTADVCLGFKFLHDSYAIPHSPFFCGANGLLSLEHIPDHFVHRSRREELPVHLETRRILGERGGAHKHVNCPDVADSAVRLLSLLGNDGASRSSITAFACCGYAPRSHRQTQMRAHEVAPHVALMWLRSAGRAVPVLP